MTDATDSAPGVSPSLLERARRRLGDGPDDDELAPDRRRFIEGLRELSDGDIEQATETFREATREAEAPFDALSRVARAECERLRDRVGVALRHWRQVAEDDDAPQAARYMAWMSIAGAADSRDDEQLLDRARHALDDLRPSETI